jgi:hypothetical protein
MPCVAVSYAAYAAYAAAAAGGRLVMSALPAAATPSRLCNTVFAASTVLRVLLLLLQLAASW